MGLLEALFGREETPVPDPAVISRVLEDHVASYRRLKPDRRVRFEQEVAGFIRRTAFRGVGGAEVTDELKVLAAASAVMLLFGRTDWEFPRVAEILFTPDAPEPGVAGVTHAFGAVVLSIPELKRSFASDSDGYHVGLHEFAHVLDLSGQQWDGVPPGMNPGPWSRVLLDEMRKAERGQSVLRPYAGTNEAEFFAVAVESFFERPEALYKANRQLYTILEEYFGRRS